LAASYLAVFLIVIAVLSLIAYTLIAGSYRSALGPALDTPEGQAGLAAALHRVAGSVAAIDLALALLVGAASYALAQAALRPLVLAREREARFAADAAHELRTPLGVIASIAQAARSGTPAEQQRALEVAAAQALEASALIGDLLTLARDPQARALSREPVDLAAVVARAAGETGERASARNIACELELQSTIVDGDERRLLQLARNLLQNALRHARTKVVLRVEPSGRSALLHVIDDGAGVAPEVRAHLFERFAKGSDSEGYGLGLAICRWVARSHGGDVALEGPAHFVVRLPLGNYPGSGGVEEEQ
jgi:signal transduction histidine kinase